MYFHEFTLLFSITFYRIIMELESLITFKRKIVFINICYTFRFESQMLWLKLVNDVVQFQQKYVKKSTFIT